MRKLVKAQNRSNYSRTSGRKFEKGLRAAIIFRIHALLNLPDKDSQDATINQVHLELCQPANYHSVEVVVIPTTSIFLRAKFLRLSSVKYPNTESTKVDRFPREWSRCARSRNCVGIALDQSLGPEIQFAINRTNLHVED